MRSGASCPQMTNATLDRLLAVLVAALAVTGLVSLRMGAAADAWLFAVHALLAAALAVVYIAWHRPRAVQFFFPFSKVSSPRTRGTQKFEGEETARQVGAWFSRHARISVLFFALYASGSPLSRG